MTDFDYIPIETTEGHRPPSPAADRLLIGLAVVALCGGLLIAVGNFLGPDDDVSVAFESPSPSAVTARTAGPSPSPRPRLELAVQPAALPSAPPQQSLFSGWIRAKTELVVRSNPRVDAGEVGVLIEGSAAQVDEWSDEPPGELGWLYVNTPQPQGWVATLDGGTPLVERYPHAVTLWGGSIWTLAAGEEGFLAIGSGAGRSDQSSPPLAMVSTDGSRWRAGDAPQEWLAGWSPAIAWGPIGWLSAVVVDRSGGPAIWFSQSVDGNDWASLGMLDGVLGDSWMGQLVANERGYLLSTSGQRSSLWFSVDGVSWHESDETGLRRDTSFRIAATPLGFYAWEDDGLGTETTEPEAAFSTDGRSWSFVLGGPGGSARQIVAVADRMLGMDSDPVSGAPRLWVGIPARGSVAWLRDTDGEASFRNAAPTTMVSDGQRAVAFGWDRSTEEPLVWASGPRGWTRSELPAEAFGGIPRVAAAGPTGFLVVGSWQTLRGMNPIIWHETDSGTWAPERSPLIPLVPDPAPDECGPPPRDAVEYTTLDRALAAACFGDEQITFRAWAAECEGCYGMGEGSYETEWLMGLTREQLYLSPVEEESYGWWAQAVVHPSLAYNASWPGQWLEVTGHFNDPAAPDCRWTPSPSEAWYYEGRQTTVDQCRQQFVVTEVSVVGGP